jgi:site-specific recombinase XerD
MPYRNSAERTHEEYLNDLEYLVASLAISGIRKVGELSLLQIERYLAELENGDLQGQPGNEKR